MDKKDLIDKLVNKIAIQAEGMLRANLAEIIEDFEELKTEVSVPKMAVTLKIRLQKRKVYEFDTAIAWNNGFRCGDVSDKEIFDTDTPDMFDKHAEIKNLTIGFQKIADKENCEITLGTPDGQQIPLAKPRKMKKGKEV